MDYMQRMISMIDKTYNLNNNQKILTDTLMNVDMDLWEHVRVYWFKRSIGGKFIYPFTKTWCYTNTEVVADYAKSTIYDVTCKVYATKEEYVALKLEHG